MGSLASSLVEFGLFFMSNEMFFSLPIIFLTLLLGTQAASLSSEQSGQAGESSEGRTFSDEVVDLGATYDYLTDNDVSYLFILVLAFQYVFAGAGWFTLRAGWMLLRGDAVGSDPDITSLSDFLLSDQTATNMVALGVGYAIAGAITWVLLSQMGEPSTANGRSYENEYSGGSILDNIVSYDGNVDLLTERTDPGFNLVEQLDNLFSLKTVLTVMLINSVLTSAFIAFWTGMRYLPARPGARHQVRRRSVSVPQDIEKLPNMKENLPFKDFLFNIGDGKTLEY